MDEEQLDAYLSKYDIPQRRSLMPWIWVLGILALVVIGISVAPPSIAPWWDCTIGQQAQNLKARIRLLDSCLAAEGLDDTDRAMAHFKRANAYAAFGRYDQALADYTATLRLAPRFAPAYYNRGNTHRVLDKNQRAIRDFGAAIRLRPTDADAHHNRGLMFIAENQLSRALQDFEAAVRIDPDHHRAWYSRGYVNSWNKNYDSAIEALNAAIELAPDVAKYHYLRAWAFDRLERYEDAIRDANTTIDLSNEPATAPNPNALRTYYDGFDYRNEAQATARRQQSRMALRPKSRMFLAYVYTKVLKRGPGSAVRTTQDWLKDAGVYDGPVDGIYRQNVADALKACAISARCALDIDPQDGLQ